MRIKNNISALNAQIALTINESKLSKDLEKLTSGYRINRSGDDAAGLAISEQMRSQIAGMAQAELNARDAIGLVRTGEGAMQEIHAMLIQMNGLAVQSANGVYTDENHRALIQEEADRICQEIDRISSATRFNYINLFQDTTKTPGLNLHSDSGAATISAGADMPLNTLPGQKNQDPSASPNGAVSTGTASPDPAISMPGISKTADSAPIGIPTGKPASGPIPADGVTYSIGSDTAPPVTLPGTGTPQISGSSRTGSGNGAGTGTQAVVNDLVFQVGPNAEQTLSIPQFYLGRKALDLDNFRVDTQAHASESLEKVEDMINYVSKIRGAYGALDNALEHTINSMNINKENLTAAESRIRDTDMASQMTEMTKNNIVMQASQAMLAQANALPETALNLLR